MASHRALDAISKDVEKHIGYCFIFVVVVVIVNIFVDIIIVVVVFYDKLKTNFSISY